MPAISEMEYGYSAPGIEKYLDEMRAIVLTEAATAVEDISEIEAACNANWEGPAKEDFIKQFKETAKYVAEQYEKLYNILQQEMHVTGASYANFDKDLFKNDK